MNKAMLIGNLGADVEMRHTEAGMAIANFRLATGERFKDKEGQTQTRTEWHRVVAFGKLAEICGEYLAKGSKVFIEGRIQTRKWENDGVERNITEIVASEMEMLGSKTAGDSE